MGCWDGAGPVVLERAGNTRTINFSYFHATKTAYENCLRSRGNGDTETQIEAIRLSMVQSLIELRGDERFEESAIAALRLLRQDFSGGSTDC